MQSANSKASKNSYFLCRDFFTKANEKQASDCWWTSARALTTILYILSTNDDGGAVILQAMRVVVQAFQTVIRASQATT